MGRIPGADFALSFLSKNRFFRNRFRSQSSTTSDRGRHILKHIFLFRLKLKNFDPERVALSSFWKFP